MSLIDCEEFNLTRRKKEIKVVNQTEFVLLFVTSSTGSPIKIAITIVFIYSCPQSWQNTKLLSRSTYQFRNNLSAKHSAARQQPAINKTSQLNLFFKLSSLVYMLYCFSTLSSMCFNIFRSQRILKTRKFYRFSSQNAMTLCFPLEGKNIMAIMWRMILMIPWAGFWIWARGDLFRVAWLIKDKCYFTRPWMF